MEFFEAVGKRHSIRAFKEKEVEQQKLNIMLNAMNSAPSAGDLQSYEVVLVKDLSTKKKIAEASLNQEFIEEAPVVFVFFANPKRSGMKYGARGEKLYCIQDATIAASYLQLAATSAGLASAWVGAFEEGGITRIVNAPEYMIPVAIIPVGYAAEQPEATPRRSIKDIVKNDKF